jgi:hypothetical protein
MRTVVLPATVLLVLPAASAVAALNPGPQDLYIRVVDNGPGLCAIVRVPGPHFMVYDTGHWQQGHICVQAAREIVGSNPIELFIVSHSDGARAVSALACSASGCPQCPRASQHGEQSGPPHNQHTSGGSATSAPQRPQGLMTQLHGGMLLRGSVPEKGRADLSRQRVARLSPRCSPTPKPRRSAPGSPPAWAGPSSSSWRVSSYKTATSGSASDRRTGTGPAGKTFDATWRLTRQTRRVQVVRYASSVAGSSSVPAEAQDPRYWRSSSRRRKRTAL